MSRIRADRYTNRAGTGAPTFSDGVNVVGITSVKSGAGVTTMEVTGDLSVISGTIKGASELSISGITSSITDTAVDVFVYDTSKDSDGGAWRKRTQNTSWYNETLNTATRGSRREFPAVAVIVVELGNNGDTALTVYDGDDPDLPMWMVFISNSGSYLQATCTSISALNGTFVVGGSNRLRHWNYIDESAYSTTVSNTSKNSGNISQRNSQSGWYQVNTNTLVNGATNDVAMTVLPNAPIDSATGLPIPTIAVATDGGTSVIKDDGSVADLTGFSPVTTVHIDEDNVIATSNSGTPSHDFIFKTHIPSFDETYNAGITAGSYNYYMNSNNTTTPLLRDIDMTSSAYNSKDDITYRGGTGGVDYINAAEAISNISTTSAIAYISKDYNTGYMQGDIKGAFLSDTDTTNLSATDLGLITNGDFSNGITGWSSDQIFTVSGGVASIQRNAGSTGQCYQTITTEIGRTYTVGVLVSAISNGFQVYKDTSSDEMSQGAVNATGTHYWSFTATSTSTRLDFSAVQNGTATASFDNITIFDGVADRSVNNNALNVTGTITRTAVATGADLVGYSGFSNSNYLEQPYNSDLAPGTSPYSVVAWFKTGPTTADQYIFDRSSDGSPRALMLIRASNGGNPNTIQFYHQNAAGTNTDLTTTDIIVTDDVWHQVVGLFDGSVYRVYIDGRASTITGSPVRDVDNTDSPVLKIGIRYSNTAPMTGNIALFRWSSTAPSPEQIKKMYEDEKYLFQENSQATLYGSSDAVTALAYDDTTDLLHVGTSAGRSEFQGLRRINNTTTAVTTAISASNELVAEQ